MPNWCHNTLTVSGDPEEVAAYVEHVKVPPTKREMHAGGVDGPEGEYEDPGQPLSFAKDVPEPAEHDLGEGGMFPGWYEWRVNHWGTKWDANFTGGSLVAFGDETADIDASEKRRGALELPGSVQYKFDTAWSPPYYWLIASSEKHPELEFVLRFGEVGNGVAGQFKVVAGLVVEETDLEVEEVLSPEEMWF
jgi:hypothetical protein